ncbi:MAG: hypothetical protein R3E13_11310 [Alphaproteobacteria bacterium]
MFSALGNIFSIKPRQAEQTDTRQDIRRHDPDYERPHKEKPHKEESDFDQDGATVSVEALWIFLENFIKNVAEENAPSAETQDPAPQGHAMQTETNPAINEKQAKSSPAAYAASSYQNAAQANEKSAILLETTDAASGPPLDLSAADIRAIHTLIEDLKILNAANIEYLKIERAASFLESLRNAVNKVKTSL